MVTYKVEMWDGNGIHTVHNFTNELMFGAWVESLPEGYGSLQSVPDKTDELRNFVHIVRGEQVLLEPVRVAKYTVLG